MAERVNSEETEFKVETFHISCASNIYENGKDYIGLILFEYNGNTVWVLNNRRCKCGYTLFIQTGILLEMKRELELTENNLHSLAYQYIFESGTMDSMVGEGFRVTRGELKWDPDVFKRNIPLSNEVRKLIEDICGIWMKAGEEMKILPKKRNFSLKE